MLYNANSMPQGRKSILLDIDPIKEYFSFLDIIEARQETANATLPYTSCADDSNRFPWLNIEAEIMENLPRIVVRKIDILKGHMPFHIV